MIIDDDFFIDPDQYLKREGKGAVGSLVHWTVRQYIWECRLSSGMWLMYIFQIAGFCREWPEPLRRQQVNIRT